MKSSLFLTLICTLSIATFAAGPESAGHAHAHPPVFAHVIGNPFDWLKSEPYNPEHIHLTIMLTRTFWVKLLLTPQELTDGICPALADIMSGAFPALNEIVGMPAPNYEDDMHISEAGHPLEEQSLSDTEESSEESGESSDNEEEYESEEYEDEYDDPHGAELNETIALADGFYDLLTVWKYLPELAPFVMTMLEQFEAHRVAGNATEHSATIWFNTIITPVLDALVEHIPFPRRQELNSGLDELTEKILNP